MTPAAFGVRVFVCGRYKLFVFVQDLNRKIDLANAAADKSVAKLKALQAQFARAKRIRDKKAAANAQRLAAYATCKWLVPTPSSSVPSASHLACRWLAPFAPDRVRAAGKQCRRHASSLRRHVVHALTHVKQAHKSLGCIVRCRVAEHWVMTQTAGLTCGFVWRFGVPGHAPVFWGQGACHQQRHWRGTLLAHVPWCRRGEAGGV